MTDALSLVPKLSGPSVPGVLPPEVSITDIAVLGVIQHPGPPLGAAKAIPRHRHQHGYPCIRQAHVAGPRPMGRIVVGSV